MREKAFSSVSLSRSVRAGDSNRFKVDLAAERAALLADARDKAFNGVDLDARHEFVIGGNCYHSHKDYTTALVLRSLASYIRKKEGITMPNRDRIVLGVIQALSDATPFYVVRLDVRSFYESIPLAGLKDRLVYSAALAPNARRVLESFFTAHCGGSTHGLPRGVGLTAVLAEVVMQDYDKAVQAIHGVYRYFRFADDILIFSTEPPSSFDAALHALLPEGMSYNPDKREEISVSSTAKPLMPREFRYLGYQFAFNDGKISSGFRAVKVSIDLKKLAKMKTRVLMSLRSFDNERNVPLLLERLRFITGNYRVKRKGGSFKGEREFIRSGIFYNYKLCGEYRLTRVADHDAAELKELDGFLHGLMRGRSSRYAATINKPEYMFLRRNLRRLSFYQSFRHRLTFRFSPRRVMELKRAWQNA